MYMYAQVYNTCKMYSIFGEMSKEKKPTKLFGSETLGFST